MANEYVIAADDNPRLARGDREMDNHSKFAYRSGAAAMAVLASLDGVVPVEEPEPSQIPEARERIAKLQAVKCSPLGDTSRPTAEMCSHCPPRYLARELEVLKPGVVVALGRHAQDGTDQAGQLDWTKQGEGYWRGALKFGAGHTALAFGLPHYPAAWGSDWPEAQAAFVADLAQRPA